ncbi:polynucleotide kinase-phosphatase [Gordonia hongkongensis]|uniref:Polynucleotide kinase-phosphatase n=1 Tax=Gordonia hongkongensis TaxID=1701090 RepID=A0AAX3T6G0_9ACTN|nr:MULTISPECIES: polynucleotide kinase-phosphatase [Gordonia]QIK46241.1 polynucleotide kinase-phosphatase [Gordonia terrae]KSU56736.1 polynucleotide kinase-phosphatase [Gordonia sp. SGD-V-85]MCX2755290.1 polynucleotide kinase-phosphatase [Gordonia sp. 4N]MDT0223321.1 polynucleotide kinase-phosphatase [Gordonia sp. AC31]UPG68150.1 polynucleotide kinase-phosphatase [Gordonia hongkongensis]
MTELSIPELSLVVLIGTTGSGKSTFAAGHFLPTEVVSSDDCRAMVSDDPNEQGATSDAFDVLEYIVGKRLDRGRLTVVDATNVQASARKSLLALAKEHDVLPVAIVLDVPVALALERNAARPDRDFGAHVVKRQHDQLRRSLRSLKREGFRTIHVLDSVEAVSSASIVRTRLFNDRRDERGPFDVIGDVHGCRDELVALLERLGYAVVRDDEGRCVDAAHRDGRRAVFVGDLVDRGPDSAGVLRLVMGMVAAGNALCVSGNHEAKLVRALGRKDVKPTHGLQETLDQLAAEDTEFVAEVRRFCDGLVAHYVLDDGRLVVAHAGLAEKYHGRASGRVRAFALYGDTSGETDEFGLPIRYPWATEYRGAATVLYGHTPVPETEWVNNTMCLDTGCVFGGSLTALRYPEREVVSEQARATYYEPVRPLVPPPRRPEVLTLTDVLGQRVVDTHHMGRVSLRDETAAGALEVMSRFAIPPAELLYLPPTMSPVDSSSRDGLLEHPDEAFGFYAKHSIGRVVCEEKHMGSRGIVRVARDGSGCIHSRTGRAFFSDERQTELLSRIADAVTRAGVWTDLDATWILVDAELLPWTAKAEAMIRSQYARVGAAATHALPAAVDVLAVAAARGIDVDDLLTRVRSRAANADRFVDSYRHHVQPIDTPLGIQVAPFQLLATDAATYETRDHEWHLGIADRLVASDPELFRPTRRLVVETADASSRAAGVSWWEDLTASGGEGMVVKPLDNLVRGPKGLVQPGLKVRGREYLRIIYGPDYTEAATLARLKNRNLRLKRSMALREYALGLEALRRAVAGEPTWRIHQCVFGVLAMESEAVDPRL